MKKTKNVLRKIKYLLFVPIASIFRFIPLQNKVIFSNFEGRGLGDDCKYILLNLLERRNRPILIWIVSDLKMKLPSGVIPVKYGSLKFLYHMCTAKVWSLNIRNLYKPCKRKNQYYIQTWHGGILGLKKGEQATERTLPPNYVRAAKQDSKIVDLFYTNNHFMENIYRNEFFDYKGEILLSDVPRMKILIFPPAGLREKVCECFGIESTKKIILYAPTFRKNMSIELFQWDYSVVVKKMQEKFNDDFVMLVRLHPNLASLANRIEYSECVMNGSLYPDMQELLAVSDVLISDYSSSIFEFGYLKKPVFLYAPDLQNFVQGDRPLHFPIESIPFPLEQNLENFCRTIENFDLNHYQNCCENFFQKLGVYDSGLGDETIANRIMEKMK